MPIRAEFRHLYRTPLWQELRARVLQRAGYRCEQCGKPDGVRVFTYTWKTREPRFGGLWSHHMVWVAEERSVWRDQFGGVVPKSRWPATGLPRHIWSVLTVAHVDGNPPNMNENNLRAWCTWCHLHHDQQQHHEARADRKDLGRPLIAGAAG